MNIEDYQEKVKQAREVYREALEELKKAKDLLRESKQIPDGLKHCCTCKEIKVISEFYKNASRSDGLDVECKNCKDFRNKQYRQSHQGREKNRLKAKKYYQEHPEKIKEWQQRNKERLRNYIREYRARKKVQSQESETQ